MSQLDVIFFSLPISRKREGGMLVFPLFHCVPTNLTLIDVNDFIFVIKSQSSLLFWVFLYTIQFGY